MLVEPISTIYFNESNGFTIGSYEVKKAEGNFKKYDIIICKGHNLPQTHDISYDMVGNWVDDKKYGQQFNVTSYKEIVPVSKKGIIAFLQGTLEGVGIKLAEDIYNEFGELTLDVLDKSPSELLKVNGINLAKLELIKSSYNRNKGLKETMNLLSSFDISLALVNRIISKYPENTELRIKQNPYILADVKGIKFSDADKIAAKWGFAANCPQRIKACIKHVIRCAEQNGNLYINKMEMLNNVISTLKCWGITNEAVANAAIELIKENEIVMAYDNIALKSTYTAETNVAENFLRIEGKVADGVIKDINSEINKAEIHFGINLNDDQRNAVISALKYKLVIITGGPGTGKTTIIKVIAYIFKNNYPKKDICFVAPTGRASRRIKETSGYEATTIHKKLGLTDENTEHSYPIEEALTIADEFSMSDIYLTAKLFSSIQTENRLILIGDKDQLPSVGPGNVLSDIIDSGCGIVVTLTQIMRQAAESNIVLNSHLIKNGNANLNYGKDFGFVPSNSFDESAQLMLHYYLQALKVYDINDIAVLCPFKKNSAAGVIEMNKSIQNVVNPPSIEKPEIKYSNTVFRENDRVMQTKNTEYASNGDIGVIKKIFEKERKMIVSINDTEIEYTGSEIKESLELAYAISIHKSQGSEYGCVITNFLDAHSRMLTRNIIYTALSRASNQVLIIGQQSAITLAVSTIATTQRLTLLTEKLRFLQQKMAFQKIMA